MTPLETDLANALTAEANSVSVEAVDRLHRAEYRPRTRRVRGVHVLGGIGASATSAGVATALLVGGASPAYAGWSAHPAAAATAPTEAVADRCAAQLGRLPGPGLAWKPVVTDTRGPYTLVVYQAGAGEAICLEGPKLTAISVTSGGGRRTATGSTIGQASGHHASGMTSGGTSVSVPSASAPLDRISQLTVATSDQGPYSVADGHAAADVSAVSLTLSDGISVAATVADGWFVAWWPSAQQAVSAQLTTPNGTVNQPIASHGNGTSTP